ncbi:MAG: hypothetical protein JWN07_2255 [Hyphomicrobiales bacterium]|nr:hypothetical protein [Hyphomicrobiales bacterium]
MRKIMLITSAALLTLGAAGSAMAQNSGAAAGATTGAVGGAIVGGPVGAVVGGVGGAIVGGIAGDSQPRFREYVVKEGRPSYSYSDDLRVGATLPSSGVTYYEVPREYGNTEYRYTRVNNRTVLVDPRTHRVVQVID